MRVDFVFGAVALALVLVIWAMFAGRTDTWHQKLTLVVETPTGEVSGSAVTEVRATFYANASLNFGTEVQYGLTGEAAVVEVPPGRLLFALMGGSEELFFRAAKDRFEGMTRGEWLRAIPGQTEPVTLTGDLIPMLVTFGDIADPASVMLVDPADLAASFGPGVRLKSVTLEVTEEAVTEGVVERVLGWVGKITGRLKPTAKKYADELTVEETLYRNDFLVGK
jgi:hypothetical protein